MSKVEDNLLAYSWEHSLEWFFPWVGEVCGCGIETNEYLELRELIKTKDDLHMFVECFDGDISDLAGVIRRMKRHKNLAS